VSLHNQASLDAAVSLGGATGSARPGLRPAGRALCTATGAARCTDVVTRPPVPPHPESAINPAVSNNPSRFIQR
jgi:hypothetical protein